MTQEQIPLDVQAEAQGLNPKPGDVTVVTADEQPQQLRVVEETPVPAPANNADALMQMIERVAMNPDADIEKMERLMGMAERVQNREAEVAFNADFALLQADLPEIDKDGKIKVGNEVRSKYARLEDINEAIKPVLREHGFAISFRVNTEGSKIEVVAVLSHRRGHSISTSMILPADNSGSKNAVQTLGSSISYGRRYTLCSLLNISAHGEDDNGEAAGKAAQVKKITEKQAGMLLDILPTDKSIKALAERFKVDDLRDLPSASYDEALALARNARKKHTESQEG